MRQPKWFLRRYAAWLVIAVAVTSPARAWQGPEVESRSVDIYGDGTRLAGNVFYPRTPPNGEGLPAILLCHGWGGVKSHLNQTYAPAFAAAGYVVLTFDYRGWGESDSRLVLVGEQPEPDENGRATVEVQMIRELVDPFDQLEDIRAALNFLEGEPLVDRDRIGIWGTSLGGGLVVWTAAHDPRVKVVVSQVGAMDGRFAEDMVEGGAAALHERAIRRARGDLPPVPQGVDQVEGLRGTPHLSRFMAYSPVDRTDELQVPTLLIDAENEELFDRHQHSELVYERIRDRVASRYHVVPAITHYGIYRERFSEGVELALAWFNEHLRE